MRDLAYLAATAIVVAATVAASAVLALAVMGAGWARRQLRLRRSGRAAGGASPAAPSP